MCDGCAGAGQSSCGCGSSFDVLIFRLSIVLNAGMVALMKINIENSIVLILRLLCMFEILIADIDIEICVG